VADESLGIGSFAEVDEAVEREFHALRAFLGQLEQAEPASREPARPAVLAPVEQSSETLLWWVLLSGSVRLALVAALRERLASMPGCLSAQVVELGPRQVRLGLTTTPQISRRQIDFAIMACRDIADAEISLRAPATVD
jgi:hypothetical protein